MKERIVQISEDFWNIRGSFRVGGVLQIGTQASLARLPDGRFVLLDSYTLPDDVLGQVRDLTSGGRDVDAIINVHPFHTIHVKRAAEQFPGARLFGSERHVAKASGLTWSPIRVDDEAMNAEFTGLQFSVPAGVDFISDDPNIHFSSVLVYHTSSKTVHVDDTFNYVDLPLLRGLRFHPTLAKALERRDGAAADFSSWANTIASQWKDAENVCAAHSSALTGISDFEGRVHAALKKVDKTLRAHRA